jgi:hypothetical protein
VRYGVVQDHLATLLDTARDRSEHGFGYPRFVEREREKFLACGLLGHGFVRVRCDTCAEERWSRFRAKPADFVLHARVAEWQPPDLRASEQAQAIEPPLPGRAPLPSSINRRSAFLEGYSLHADHLIDANDRDGLERLCRHGARSPVANTRRSLDPSGRVVVSLKRPLRDGRTELAFTPIDFLRRLATLIPPPRSHLTRYHGVFAPNHHLRAAIVPSACTDQPPPSAPSAQLGRPPQARVRHRCPGLRHLRRQHAHPCCAPGRRSQPHPS